MSDQKFPTRRDLEYRADLFDMTRTTKSWLDGFPARISGAEEQLGERSVHEAKKQYEIIKTAEVLYHRNYGKANHNRTVKNLIFAAAKLNELLLTLEFRIKNLKFREQNTKFSWHNRDCPTLYGGDEKCECFE